MNKSTCDKTVNGATSNNDAKKSEEYISRFFYQNVKFILFITYNITGSIYIQKLNF